MADEAARLVAIVEANIHRFTKGMDDARRIADQRFGAIEKTMRRTESSFSTFGSGIAAKLSAVFTVAAISAFVKNIAEAADKLEALSQRTGVSAENLQKIAGAARQANVDTSDMNSALDILARNLGKAGEGGGDLQKVFQQFGVSTGRDLTETLLNIADAVKNASTRQEEYRITTVAFGKSNVELVNFLRQGSAAIREQVDAFSGAVSSEAIHSLAEFNKNWQEVSISFQNMAAGPASFVLAGFADFLKALDQGSWPQKLQALSSFFSGGIIAQPAINLEEKIAKAGQELDLILMRLQRIQDLRDKAAASGAIGFGIPTVADVQSVAAEMAAKQKELAALAKQRLTLPPSNTPDKPFGAVGGAGASKEELAALEQFHTDAAAAWGRYFAGIADAHQVHLQQLQAFQKLIADAPTVANASIRDSLVKDLETLTAPIGRDIQNIVDGLEESDRRAQQFHDTLRSRVIGDVAELGATALTSADNFGEAIGRMLQSIAQLILQLEITKALESSIGTGGGLGGLLKGIGSLIGIGSGKASGGSVQRGVMYPVGERGKEWFLPNVNGTIVPQVTAPISGGGRVATFAPVINVDARGAQAGVAEQIAAVMPGVIARAVKQSDQRFAYNLGTTLRDKG